MSIRYFALFSVAALIPLVGCQGPLRPANVVLGADMAPKPAQGGPIAQQASSKGDRPNRLEKEAKATVLSEPKQDDWQRRKDCVAQAERVMKDTRLQENKDVINWENHYNPKYESCFVLVDFKNPDAENLPAIPSLYFELYDAFDRRLLSTCQDDLDKKTFCLLQTEGTLGAVDCRVCRSFVKERMEN